MNDSIRYDRRIFADNLARLMKLHDEKQVDVARLLGVTKAAVSAYIHGQQMPRMDKIELLAQHYGISRGELLSEEAPPPPPESAHPAVRVYESLNEQGQSEFIRYGRFLAEQPAFRVPPAQKRVDYIKHFLVPAAAGYASPIEGEDYELLERDMNTPQEADFCISISGDSMEPYIRDGTLVYVKRGAEMHEFDVGIFYVDGDVFCKQWCLSYDGSLYLLSANPLRRDANIVIPRESGRMCVCFGKVLLPTKLPEPQYR